MFYFSIYYWTPNWHVVKVALCLVWCNTCDCTMANYGKVCYRDVIRKVVSIVESKMSSVELVDGEYE